MRDLKPRLVRLIVTDSYDINIIVYRSAVEKIRHLFWRAVEELEPSSPFVLELEYGGFHDLA